MLTPRNRFCTACGLPASATGLAEAPASFDAAPSVAEMVRHGGERRQLTLMFIDVVGSTAMATRLDPEELGEVIDDHQRRVATVAQAHGGRVVKLLGDGALIYFGFPQASEDDAQQAVRTALALMEAPPNDLALRIGIATGIVVVGDRAGPVGDGEPLLVGETPNLASRLQEVATTGKVVVCPTTRRLVAGYFAMSEPELMLLKGFDAPIAVTTIERDLGRAGRFEVQRRRRLMPLLGREEELELLQRRWITARNGEGRVVVLVGEGGLGKSRILQALKEAIVGDQPLTLRFDGSQHHDQSALFPIITHLERAAGIRRGDAVALRKAKLQTLLADADDDGFAAIASMVVREADPSACGVEANLTRRKALIFETMLSSLVALTRQRPVLVVFEDLHWMDPTTLEFLTHLVERAPELRLLVVATSRPEFHPPWPNHSHISTLMLTRLAPKDTAALVALTAGGRQLPGELLQQLIARTDGVPLFVEELTKMILESGALSEHDGDLVLDRPLLSLTIPETLQGSLFARLDRLEQVREIAQTAAAIGRAFHFELLRAVAGVDDRRLIEALDALVRAELVFRRGAPPEATYTFKHALVRDAAYAGLLKRRRRELHGAIGTAMEVYFPDLVEAEPETLAAHFDLAGETRKAIAYWIRAGRSIADRSAPVEAATHFKRGWQACETLPAGRDRDRLMLDCLFGLGPCVIATSGPAATDAVAVFEAAQAACERLGDAVETPQVMFWVATASVIRGELAKADAAVRTLLGALDGTNGDRAALLNAHRGRAMIQLFCGRPEEARANAARFLLMFEASSEQAQHAARAAGQDAMAAGLAILAWSLWLVGEETEALAASERACARAAAVGHPHSEAYTAYYAAVLNGLCGKDDAMRRLAERCLALANAHGFGQWLRLARALLGICVVRASPANALDALGDVGEAIADYRRDGYQLGMTALDVLVAPTLLGAGHLEAARERVEDGLSVCERHGERLFEAELLRLRAELEAVIDPLLARRTLEAAAVVARAQGAVALETRIADVQSHVGASPVGARRA